MGILVGVALPIIGFNQARRLPEQFFPPADRDQIQIELELSANASLRETVTFAKSVRDHILQHKQVEQVHWFVGESAPTFYYNVIPRRKNTARYAQALVQVSSAGDVLELIRGLQADLDTTFPAARILVRQLEQGPPFDAPVEVRLYGPDTERLRELGDQVQAVLVETADVLHTRARLSETLPKLKLSVDEEQARLVGLDHAAIASQLYGMLEGTLGGTVLETTEELPVRVRVTNTERANLDRIASLDLLATVPSGPAVESAYRGIPLSTIAEVGLDPEVAVIPHYNGRRMNEVQAYITAGVLPAEVLSRFESNLAESGFELPPGYSYEFGGEAAKRDEAIGNLMANVGVLAVLMVGTLVLSFLLMCHGRRAVHIHRITKWRNSRLDPREAPVLVSSVG